MANYYFATPSLPLLQVGEWPDLTFDELMTRLYINLTRADFEKTYALRRYLDFLNLRALFRGQPIDPRGNLSEKELDDAILTQSDLPEYVFSFLKKYEEPRERMHHLSYLLTAYFREEKGAHGGFLNRYFTFEWEWRLVLTAIRAKKLGRDLAEELEFEDKTDPFVADILAQRESEIYVPPKEYADLAEKHVACGRDPWGLHETFSKWHFDRIAGLAEGPLFSVDWILAYLAQHMLVEDGVRMSLERGEEILRNIVGSA